MRYWITAAVILVLDQVSKGLAVAQLEPGASVPVLPPVLYLTLVTNPGAAFGLLADQPMLLIGLSIGAVLMVWYYRAAIRSGTARSKWGIALALCGTLGNLLDRIRLGEVVDFIDIRVWPIFNVADTAIVLGVLLLFWEVLVSGRQTT